MQTERITFLTTPDGKAALASRAAARGVSVGEYIRRKVEEEDSDDFSAQDEAELAILVAQVNEAMPKMEASLDEMSQMLRATHQEVDRMLRAMGAR
jgi:hypothetical protein